MLRALCLVSRLFYHLAKPVLRAAVYVSISERLQNVQISLETELRLEQLDQQFDSAVRNIVENVAL